MEDFEKQLRRAEKLTEHTNGGILVITEGVFGMRGDMGKLKEIAFFKKTHDFTLLVDDAHGIGVMGPTGAGTGELQGMQDAIDLYFGTFAKAFAAIGAFISGKKEIIQYLRYNMRSQIYAKSLPMPVVFGLHQRLQLIREQPELRIKLWQITHELQDGLRAAGLDIGNTESPVTPVYLQGSIQAATKLVGDLREHHDIFCSMVVYPVIPKGMIILRLIPTAIHTFQEVYKTIAAFKAIGKNLEDGKYDGHEKPFYPAGQILSGNLYQ
jgi:glycine C-acetyltransferase